MKTVYIFIEPMCPYCRYVHNRILRDILVRRPVLNQKMHQQGIKQTIQPFDIKVVDIVANRGTKEEQWFKWYSLKIGGRYTPVVMIDEVGFYLWGGDKPKKLTADELSRTDKLKSQIIAELTEDVFVKEPQYFDKTLMHADRGIL